jgi:conjugal transfer pilin signal peptidase TrbI
MNMRRFNIYLIFTLIISGILFWIGIGIRYNVSDSLPFTLYISTPLNSIERELIVNFQLDKSSAVFAKIIAGVPGDRIWHAERVVYVNNKRIGEVLDFREPIPEGIIPPGFYFMKGIHPKSFDSRYKEFGLVSKNAIKEQLLPLF